VNEAQAGTTSEVIIYVSDLPDSALYELDRIESAESPGGTMIGLPNTGDELDPPPENDPHLTFPVQVVSGVPYRCWVHMRVGTPKGKSQANVVWVQFSDAVGQDGQAVLVPDSNSYLTAQGPGQEGWTWVSCDMTNAGSAPGKYLVNFNNTGEVDVRVQAGMEGVAIDQFVLSPAKYLENPPAEPVVK
jgi:hypothetical protein